MELKNDSVLLRILIGDSDKILSILLKKMMMASKNR